MKINLTFIKKVEPGLVYMVVFSIIGITLLASYLYLFKQPLRVYSQQNSQKNALELRLQGRTNLQGIISNLEKEVQQLRENLYGTGQIRDTNKMISSAIDLLDRLAVSHGVQLISVRPEKPRKIKHFEEMPFYVEVTGEYLDLYQWLFQIERQIGSMVAKKININGSSNQEAPLTMRISLAAYRPLQEGL